MERFLSRNKKLIFTLILAVVCLFLVLAFPTEDVPQNFISLLAFFLVIPILYVKIILKKDLSYLGLQWGNWKKGIVWSVLSLVLLFPLLYALFNYTGFSESYSPPGSITNSFWIFVLYEVLIIGAFALLYELFFRGFVMLSVAEEIGYWSIFLQLALFFSYMFLAGNFDWNNLYFLLLAPFSGIIVYKSRSILYPLIISIIFIAVSDSIIINIIK